MNRVRQSQGEMVAAALALVPERLLSLVACDLFCEDPVFTGLHDTCSTDDGRAYRDMAHVCYPYHVADRRTTLVLPVNEESVFVGLHELGHVLHWNLQERAGGWEKLPRLEAVTRYAETNVLEEFAEAFAAWFYPARQVEGDTFWTRWSRANDEFFDRLAVGA